MKEKKLTNITESIKAKLTNYAKQTKRSVDAVYLQYCQERLLYRISQSKYKNNFILKGGLSLLALEANMARPTKDIDFLVVSTSNEFAEMENIFKEIIKIEFEDGITFEPDIKLEEIRKDAEYQGIRLKILAKLDRSKSMLTVDIGFGDKILGKPEEIEFPVILKKDSEIPIIKTYPVESIIAEKFQAMVMLNYQNSRFKDFYDILFIAGKYNLQLERLYTAINKTFTYRETPIEDKQIIFSDDFKNDLNMKSQWTGFLTVNNLKSFKDFSEVVSNIESFINTACKPVEEKLTWKPSSWSWE